MSDPESGIALNALAKLSQMSGDELKALLETKLPNHGGFTIGEFVLGEPDQRGLFSHAAALTIEIARQFSDNAGLAPSESLRVISYAGAVENYLAYPEKITPPTRKADCDFWISIVGARNTWGSNEPRGSFEVTGFGDGEFWSTSHFHGSFDQITAEIKSQMTRDGIEYPDTDYSRIFMANVSAADRRLRERAKLLEIAI